ncbi:hypothetical protein PSMK_00170 [Phycisphaera mikurensis NBRC 102666]|uniref:Uncharacterized protein n=1 Tax=Phycisphaera mikurensis (strain NBRC 102666 / KCTC 22515 / FYK2301M01) TaxID=1142394 RepID=I0IA88_PHYMF|nr:hypothetical protein PSMK_00170 [Phycisphaera mikurensis NBRC 102666]
MFLEPRTVGVPGVDGRRSAGRPGCSLAARALGTSIFTNAEQPVAGAEPPTGSGCLRHFA